MVLLFLLKKSCQFNMISVKVIKLCGMKEDGLNPWFQIWILLLTSFINLEYKFCHLETGQYYLSARLFSGLEITHVMTTS